MQNVRFISLGVVLRLLQALRSRSPGIFAVFLPEMWWHDVIKMQFSQNFSTIFADILCEHVKVMLDKVP